MTSRGGYTLVELMMVVMVIAVSVIAFAPGLSRAMTDRRVSAAARELIRIGRRARSDSIGSLRAHLLWIVPATGRVMLLRGPNNSCTTLRAWQAISADCVANPVLPDGQRCVEDVTMSALASGDAVSMYEELVGATGAVTSYGQLARAICYAPSGTVYHGTGTDLTAATTPPVTFSELNTNVIRGGFVYTLHRTTAPAAPPTASSRVHRVLFPLGSSARSIR